MTRGPCVSILTARLGSLSARFGVSTVPKSSSVVETPGTAPVADAPGPVPVSVADAPGPTSGPTSDKHGDTEKIQKDVHMLPSFQRGVDEGMQALIGLDGCHTKGHHHRQLLTAIGIDANNKIFPIAYAMVERESEETWTWFLGYLQQDVKIERDSSYVFITDKQKGLDNALKVGDNQTRKTIYIVVAVSVVSISGAIIIFIFNKRRANGRDQSSPSEDYDLPLLDFNSISVATNFFNVANKLGQGGFGPVYKRPSSFCHDDESSALLQFKQSFVIDEFASVGEGAYPRVLSWKPTAAKECCSWEGVECDEKTGHVISLDLSSSYLSGSLDSNSTLFHLVHLQRLNLADNDFNQSQIPTTIRNLPMLHYLDLSGSFFSGQIPSEISQLSKLSSLDLSSNTDSTGERSLMLNQYNLKRLVQNLTSLEKLHLSSVLISAPVLDSVANLPFLTSLLLEYCDMRGDFPVSILKLQSLKFLNVESNPDLFGFLPAFEQTSPLMSLRVFRTRFTGSLPFSIKKLDSLNELVASRCNFSGLLPSSLGNLRRQVYLDLSNNTISGSIPASLATLTQLSHLSLDNNHFRGYIPSSLGNLIQLTTLSLATNQLTGPIPSSLGKLIQLTELDLSGNDFGGYIPSSIGNLNQLLRLSLSSNQLTGPIPYSVGNLSNLIE
ncbi:hypothetical protein ACLB2K_020711 [Fragaria x ananassa]